MRVIGILQARDESKRLPKKATTLIGDKVMIHHVWDRLCAVGSLDGVCVSTSVDSPEIIGWCKLNEINHYVGSEADLLSRHLNAAIVNKADAILRVTSDCVFHDPVMLEKMVIGFKQAKGADAMINWHYGERSASEGVDAEIVSVKCMRKLDADKNCPREDWLSYLDTHTARHRVMGWKYPNKFGHLVHLSVDTKEDLEMARRIMDYLGPNVYDYKSTMEAWESVQNEARSK